MKKNIFLACLSVLAFSYAVTAQNSTDVLDSVLVTTNSSEVFNSGTKKQIISDNNSAQLRSMSLSELLLQSSPLLIKSSGSVGATSSVSLRGAGAGRSQISWEGFPINSLTAGENDISLVPAQSFNYIAVNHSAVATQFGSGAFGGAIELQNKPQWDEQFTVQASASVGSFETYKTQAGVALGNAKVHYNSSFFYNQAASNFSYFDYIAQQTRTRRNADFRGYGTTQNIHLRPTQKSTLHGSVWYQVKDMNLPSIMGSNSNNIEHQVDSSLRTMLHFHSFFGKSSLSVRVAYIYDYLRYTKKVTPQSEKYLTYSEIESNRFLQAAQYRYYATGRFTLDAELQSNYSTAQALSYYAPKSEYSLAGIVAARYMVGKFQSMASLRKEYNTQYSIPLIFNIGVQQYLFAKRMLVRANVGSKYRTPTFNDLYWEGWGNPNLKPEHGHTAEAGMVVDWLKTNKNILSSDVTAFFSTINNMIMWVPNGAVWNPLNIAQAQLRGVEVQLNYTKKWKTLTWNNCASSDFNFSRITKIHAGDDSKLLNHALYYVPKVSINYSPSIVYKHFEIGAAVNRQSARYFDLSQQLDAFTLFDAFVGYTHSWKKITLAGTLVCKNICNTAYELSRSFPMPGRYWEINLRLMVND
jgi:outer membrane cobalamin receptor